MLTLTSLFLEAIGTTGLIHLLIGIIVAALVIWVVYYLIGIIGVPEPFRKIIYVVLALIFIVYLLSYFGMW